MLLEKNGKVITNIEFAKKDITLYFDKEKVVISKLAYDSTNLFIGKTMTLDELENLKDLSNYSKHLIYAYNLLAKRRYSELKIREKLIVKGASDSDANKVINKLKENGLIDDMSLIKDIIRSGNEKNLGKYKIITSLKNNGLSNGDLINMFDERNEIEKAIHQLHKLESKYSNESYLKRTNHIFHQLQMLGFEVNVINEAMTEAKEKNENDEFLNLENDFKKAILRLEINSNDKLLKQKLIKALLGKGYEYNDIIVLWEEYINEINS